MGRRSFRLEPQGAHKKACAGGSTHESSCGQARTRVTGLTPRFDEVSAMTSDRTILITGVTGNQGGAVARALQGTGFHLRGLTRTPDSERAEALARQGVDVVKGDLDDETTLRRALAGAWGVFGVQTALEAGVEREE